MEWTYIIHSCKACGASWHAPKDEPHACAVQMLQEAVDRAYGLLNSSAYVGGPSEREAWQGAMEALGPIATQHVGQDTSGPFTGNQKGDGC